MTAVCCQELGAAGIGLGLGLGLPGSGERDWNGQEPGPGSGLGLGSGQGDRVLRVLGAVFLVPSLDSRAAEDLLGSHRDLVRVLCAALEDRTDMDSDEVADIIVRMTRYGRRRNTAINAVNNAVSGCRTDGFLAEFVEQCSQRVLPASAADPNVRARFAVVFLAVCKKLRPSVLLPSFSACFALSLCGIGHADRSVRLSSTAAFRRLVPLAPLARQGQQGLGQGLGQGQGSVRGKGRDLVEGIFSRDPLIPLHRSDLALDMRIVSELRRLGIGREGDGAAVVLREYQWEGLTYLTQLRRCGLSGMLADEMGLGKRQSSVIRALH